MSEQVPEPTPTTLPAAAEPVALRREALLPNERNRGLGTVAVVCTMAGVASGLALATTLMAMQVADSMSTSRTVTCSFASEPRVEPSGHGFLGIRYTYQTGGARVEGIISGTPAEAIGLRKGDIVIAVNGNRVESADEMHHLIYDSYPGSEPTVLVRRGEEIETFRPILASWPVLSY